MLFELDLLPGEEVSLRLLRTADADSVRDWLPAYYFEILRADGVPVGVCDLRIGHNTNSHYGGNIGYEVFDAYRGHRYAAKACKLLLPLAKRHDMGYVIITCSPDNAASRRTCELAGCTLQAIEKLPPTNEMYQEGQREKCVYRITLA